MLGCLDMFFNKANILFAGFTITILATLGSAETGQANELKIEEQDLISDELKSYYRSFTVSSNYYPVISSTRSILMPEMVWPTDEIRISSGYGWRPRPCSTCSSDHKGVDFDPGRGKPVYASMDGIVSKVGYSGSFGQHIYIEHIANFNNTHFYKWQTVYAHLEVDTIPENLRVGNIVKAGEVIGTVGNTGTSTGPHLHFELLVEGENVDPEKYLLMYANR
jgi:murein DD-endopeptidase MepM/ murein hydrolase activator NlpD